VAGMVYATKFNGDLAGFEWWDEWSSAYHKYSREECNMKWKSFESDNRGLNGKGVTTFASAIRLAKIARGELKPEEKGVKHANGRGFENNNGERERNGQDSARDSTPAEAPGGQVQMDEGYGMDNGHQHGSDLTHNMADKIGDQNDQTKQQGSGPGQDTGVPAITDGEAGSPPTGSGDLAKDKLPTLHDHIAPGGEGATLHDHIAPGGEGATVVAPEAGEPLHDADLDVLGPAPVLPAGSNNGSGDHNVNSTVVADSLPKFIDSYIYIADGDKVHDLTAPPSQRSMLLKEFVNWSSKYRMTIEVPAPTEKDPFRVKEKRVPVSSQWLIHEDRQTAIGFEYLPGGDRLIQDRRGSLWVNEFYMPEFPRGGAGITSDWAQIRPFRDHMEYLFPIFKECEWFIDWIAFTVFKPEIRCKVTPLHVAVDHGTGRGWLVALLRRLLGPWNVAKTKMSTLAGEGGASAYNEYMHNSLLCCIEEVKEGGHRYAISDNIRDVLTEPSLEVNVKYGSKGTRNIYTNFFMMSNNTDALVLTPEDRRINVFKTLAGPKPQSYYDKLYGWLASDDNMGALWRWLRGRDLKGFAWQRSMETEGRESMIEYNQTATEQAFRRMCKESDKRVMTYKEILEEIALFSEEPFAIDDRQVLKLLQKYSTHFSQLKIHGENVRPWALARGAKMTNEEIRNSLKRV